MPPKNTEAIVALIRGINVGGHRPLAMKRLREIVESLGYTEARTYLQSGNVVFEARAEDPRDHARTLQAALRDKQGLDVPVVALTARDLRRVVSSNPFLDRKDIQEGHLHVAIPAGSLPRSGLGKDPIPAGPGEEAVVASGAVYLLCPGGYGQTKLTNAVLERRLGLPVTVRNWRTICELDRMAARAPSRA
jgi:uncharacterized protein (DUF1697 family)